MAPTAGMIRYNTDTKYWERSIDEGANWLELDLSGITTVLSNLVNWRGVQPNNLVSGRVDSSVGAVANDAITAAAIAANAIGASEFAQGAADKVWATTVRALTDKAGFTLTAGSYSLRLQNNQRGTLSVSSTTSATAGISTVALEKTRLGFLGCTQAVDGNTLMPYLTLQTTTVTINRFSSSASATTVSYEVEEDA